MHIKVSFVNVLPQTQKALISWYTSTQIFLGFDGNNTLLEFVQDFWYTLFSKQDMILYYMSKLRHPNIFRFTFAHVIFHPNFLFKSPQVYFWSWRFFFALWLNNLNQSSISTPPFTLNNSVLTKNVLQHFLFLRKKDNFPEEYQTVVRCNGASLFFEKYNLNFYNIFPEF